MTQPLQQEIPATWQESDDSVIPFRSAWSLVWMRFRRNKTAIPGAVIVFALAASAFATPAAA